MRLDSDHTNLFLVTIHAFVVALPSVPGRDEAEDDPDKLILLNSIGNLRFEIRDLQNTLTKERAEYDIPSEDHGRASNHVEDILNVLDDLIDDAIPNQFIYSPVRISQVFCLVSTIADCIFVYSSLPSQSSRLSKT